MSGLDDGAIVKILQTAALRAVVASNMPLMPVKLLGRTFDAVSSAPDGRYLEVVIIPNNRKGDFWGSEQNYQGLLRLILHWQNDDQGVYKPLEFVKSVCSYFSKETLLFSEGGSSTVIQIYENPTLTGLLEEGDKLLYPVSISYRSHRPA